MIAVVLAAGMAKRLRPLTDTTPKCLLKIGKKSLLERTFNALKSVGVTQFVVVTGYLHEQIEAFLSSRYPQEDILFEHNAVFESTNNIYSLWLAMKYVKGKEFLLLDSDILFDPILLNALVSVKGSSLAVNQHPLGEEEMKVVVNAEGTITQITKECSPKMALGESVGIEKISNSYSQALYEELEKMMNTEHLENVFYELAFERLIAQGHSFKVVDTTSIFSTELDTVEDFQNAQKIIPQHLY